MKIIQNFLSEEKHKQIERIFMMGSFPYFYQSTTADPNDKSYFFFGHTLYNDKQPNNETWIICNTVVPLVSKVPHEEIIRAKVNLYTKTPEPIVTGFHIDQDAPHKVLLYSVNTNNGYTLFENGEKVPSIANQAVIFDGHLKHSSVTQTDENIRVNVNINFS